MGGMNGAAITATNVTVRGFTSNLAAAKQQSINVEILKGSGGFSLFLVACRLYSSNFDL